MHALICLLVNVVWKLAEKGGGIVLMDSDNYTAEIYMKLKQNPTAKIKEETDNFLYDSVVKGYISQTELKYLKAHPMTPVIYVMPKIHKSLINPLDVLLWLAVKVSWNLSIGFLGH